MGCDGCALVSNTLCDGFYTMMQHSYFTRAFFLYIDVHEQWCCRVMRKQGGQALFCSQRQILRSVDLSNGVGRMAESRKSILR